MIWCAVPGHGILGPYFVDDAQNPLAVNQERYRDIIIAPFVRGLKGFCRARNQPLRWQWMQKDGVTAHTTGESLACLQQHFSDRLISRGTEFPFPSNSSDVTAPMPIYSACWKNPFSDQMTHLEMFLIYGDTVIFSVLGTTCIHQHVQQSKGPLWTMCETWG